MSSPGSAAGRSGSASAASSNGDAAYVVVAVVTLAGLVSLCLWTGMRASQPLMPVAGMPPIADEIDPLLGGGETVVHDYTWNVAERVQSTFRPQRLSGLAGEVSGLDGALDISVPNSCEDRTVHWQITVDGKRQRHGTVKWQRDYHVPTRFPLHGADHAIALSADWNGSTRTCPSFTMVWRNPTATRSLF